MRLAMRSGSSAEANAIIEKLGTSTKAKRSGSRACGSARPEGLRSATTRFMAAAFQISGLMSQIRYSRVNTGPGSRLGETNGAYAALWPSWDFGRYGRACRLLAN